MKSFKEFLAEQLAQINEKTITTIDGPKSLRPGSERSYTIEKYLGTHKHESGEIQKVYVVKRDNGFYGVLILNDKESYVVSQTFKNHSKESAMNVGNHYLNKGMVGMSKLDPWYIGGDKVKSIK